MRTEQELKESYRELESRVEERTRLLTDANRQLERRAKEAEESRRILEALLNNIPEGLAIAEAPEGALRFVSTYYKDHIAGYFQEARAGTLKPDVSAFRDAGGETPRAMKSDLPSERALKKGETVIGEEWNLRRDSATATMVVNAVPVRDANGVITHAVVSWQDITYRKKIEDDLRRNEYELRTLVDNTPDLVFRMDRSMRYVYANAAYEKLTGLKKERLSGKTNSELGMPREQVRLWESSVKEVIESGRETSVEFSFSSLFGKRHFWARVIPEFANTGLIDTVMVISRDITERKKSEEHIRFISFHDQVTGLYNRTYFEEEIQRRDNARELPLSIIMGDVNNLKFTNDIFGHEEGDRLLKNIGSILRVSCRKSDVIARWGGDEFVMILPKTDEAATRKICSKIEEECGRVHEVIVPPSIALGMAAKTRPEENVYRVLREAEEKMYRNKSLSARENQRKVVDAVCRRLVEKRPDIAVHIERLETMAEKAAPVFMLSGEQTDDLRKLAALHEMGKVTVPDSVWLKPGPLLPHEWALMRKHSETAYRIAHAHSDYAHIADILLAVNEQWDGSGYPRGLKGEEIPFLARAFALLDAYDAMIHHSPYHPAMDEDAAVRELRRGAGKQFDPALAEKFIRSLSGKVGTYGK